MLCMQVVTQQHTARLDGDTVLAAIKAQAREAQPRDLTPWFTYYSREVCSPALHGNLCEQQRVS